MANNNNTKNLNVPTLRFPEFTGEWEETIFEKVCNITTGNKNTQDKEEDGEYPFYVRSEIVERINSYSFNGEAILTAGDGVGVGKVFHYVNGKVGVHQRVYILSDFECSCKFAYYYFSGKFYNRVKRMSAKNSVDSVRRDMIAQMPILLPVRCEQNKIATFLSFLDRRIEIQGKIIERFESLIKGLSESLFSHKLGFEGFKQNWDMKYGNEIFLNISDKNQTSNLPILAITQEYGAIPRDLIDYKVTVTDKSVESYKVVQIGDFIISLRSFQGGIEYSNYKGICSPAYIVLRSIIPINNIFYKYYLKTNNYIAELNRKLEGIRDGKMISYKQFSEIPLPYPTITEQNEIAKCLSVINKKLETEKLILKRYSKQKKYLLNNLLM
ncbi:MULTISPECIES: restriction endonuclease subunit S [Bacteroides]|uniref:restriction endonuclease subunit S n=1 Tax=Bacteroides TaxID=816 RepID=UPI0018F6CF11|nr:MULTISPECIES: restriction endonuclease subunit S [Bacteroides]